MTYTRLRHLAFESSEPPPTDEQLAELETLLSAPLPASFREFLAAGNGGSVEYLVDVHLGDGRTEALCFSRIFSADPGARGSLFAEIRSQRERRGIPPGVLPFARDGGGSIAFLHLTVEGRGRVVAFVSGRPKWTGRPYEPGFIQLASSFDDYIDRLRLDREAALDGLTDFASELAHVEATEEWLDIGLPRWRDDEEVRAAVEEARRRVSTA